MERILKIFSKETGSVNQAALVLGILALAADILALFRDRSIAHFIGPSPQLDAYYAAFRVPDLVFVCVASLASITVLIPFISAKMAGGKVTKEAEKFLSDVFTVFLAGMILVATILFFLMPHLIFFIAPGFTPAFQVQAVLLSRIMLLSPILLGLSNLFGTITQLFHRFFIFSLSPIFYNLGIIVGAVILYPIFGIYGLVYGVILGALIHFLIQVVAAHYCGFTPKFSLPFFAINFTEIKKVVATSLPRTLGLAFNNVAEISMTAFASFLAVGSISIFNFSFNLQSVPLGIIGVSYAVAAFPTLARSISEGRHDHFNEHLKSSARAIVFWSIPATFLFIVLRAQIVRVVLGSGAFSWNDTRLVAACLAIFSLSILAQGMIALVSRAYYAKGKTKPPLIMNFVCSVLIIVFAFLLMKIFENFLFFRYFMESLLKVSDLPGTEVMMLPMAYSLGTILNFVLHWIFVKKDFMPNESFITKTFFQSLGASFFLGLVSYLSLNILSPIFGTTTFMGVFWQGFISGIIGIIAAIIVLYLLKSEELAELIKTLRSKFWRAKVVVESPEDL
jgi:putative peptidoglycan lipid II flippase